MAGLEHVSQVLKTHHTVPGKRVDLSDGHHVGQDVTQPLGIHEIKVSESVMVSIRGVSLTHCSTLASLKQLKNNDTDRL